MMLQIAHNVCTQNKTKGLFAKRKPYYQNESRAIVLLCTRRGKVGALSLCIFSAEIRPGDGGEGNVLESFIFSGAFAVLH